MGWWRYLDALQELQKLKAGGMFAHLGLANFDTAHLEVCLASGIKIATNQVCFSLLDMRAAEGLTACCLKFGVRILAFGTLAGGLLSDRWLGRAEPTEANGGLRTWSLMKYKRFVEAFGGWDLFQELLRVLRRVADRHDSSISNVAVRYILDQPAVAAVIIGVRPGESQHIDSNQRVHALRLTQQDTEEVRAVLLRSARIPGDCGDEYRKAPFLTASGDLSHHLSNLGSLPNKAWGLERREVTDQDGQLSQKRRRFASRVFSGTVWEETAGFCRAIRRGRRIFVSGTTATHGQMAVAGALAEGTTACNQFQLCAAAQMTFILDKIEASIRLLGGCGLEDVVRTRIFVPNLDRDWRPIASVHGNRFAGCPPANTLVGAALVGSSYFVEVEADAEVDDALS